MRVVFLGNAGWSVPSLEAVAASSHRPVLVLTRSARPAGRGNALKRSPVAEAAERLGVPLLEIETVKTGPGFDALFDARPEVLVVVAYGEILPSSVLDVPTVAPVNVHFSLLPRLRGPAPVQRAILEGEEPTGVTTIRMDEGVDTGPILLQRTEPVWMHDDAGDLGEALAKLGGQVLVETLDGLERGELRERPQEESKATYAPKPGPGDRRIRWADASGEGAILATIAAMSPDPGAETSFRGRLLKVFRAAPADRAPGARRDLRPGEILIGPGGELVAGTPHRPLVLEEVQPEGKRRMSGAEFVRGYRPDPGEILG
jgi:methionyl-tRNA formyltransferase